jgi:hypothetical protein
MRLRGSAIVLGAMLALARAPAGANTALTKINVHAQILSNCLLRVQSDSPQAGISINLRCAQDTVARIEVEPNAGGPARPAGGRRSALAVAQGADGDPAHSSEEGWASTGTFVTGTHESWVTTVDHKTPASDELTVHVDF